MASILGAVTMVFASEVTDLQSCVFDFTDTLLITSISHLSGNLPFTHNGDSVVVDAVNNGIRANGTIGGERLPVAGVAEATVNNILVRKAGITQGNTNWETSRGVSEEDSEWIVIPQDAAGAGKPFTTLGSHGDFSLSITSSTITIDLENKKMFFTQVLK